MSKNSINFHGKLGEYFFSKKFYLDDHKKKPNNRKLFECPYQFLESKRILDLTDFFSDQDYQTLMIQQNKYSDMASMFKDGFELAIQLNEIYYSTKIGLFKIKSETESKNTFAEYISSLVESDSTDFKKLSQLFHNRPSEELSLAYELLYLRKLYSIESNCDFSEFSSELYNCIEKTKIQDLPGPIALPLIEFFDNHYTLFGFNFLKIKDWEIGEQYNYLMDLVPATKNYPRTAVYVAKCLSLLVHSLRKELFINNAILTRTSLLTEHEKWGELSDSLLHTRYSIDLMHLTLTWVNRRIDQMGKISKHIEHNRINGALYKCWKFSRQFTSQGARVATELILLSKHLVPNSGLAEDIENDFTHRLKRSRKLHHKAFIYANMAELKFLSGNGNEAEILLKESINIGQTDILSLSFIVEITSTYKGSTATLSLLDALVGHNDLELQSLKKTAWHLFRVRLLEEAEEKAGTDWGIWLAHLTKLYKPLNAEETIQFKHKMLFYTIIFSTISWRFFPSLRNINQSLFYKVVNILHEEIKLPEKLNSFVEKYLKNKFINNDENATSNVFKFPWHDEFTELLTKEIDFFMDDIICFRHLPSQLIPVPLNIRIFSKDYNGRRPWLNTESWMVQTKEELNVQVELWRRKLSAELINRLGKDSGATSINLDSTNVIQKLVEMYIRPAQDSDEINEVFALLNNLCSNGKILQFRTFPLYVIALDTLSKERKEAKLLSKGYSIEMLMKGNKIPIKFLFTWWWICIKNDETRKILLRGINNLYEKWWEWTSLSGDLPKFLTEIAYEGEIEIIDALRSQLPDFKPFIEGNDILPAMSHLLIELWLIEAKIKRKLPFSAENLRQRIEVIQYLFKNAVNETYMKPYLAFWRLVMLYPEFENNHTVMEMLPFISIQTKENIKDQHSQIWFSQGLAKAFLFSNRTKVPIWIDNFSHFSGADAWLLAKGIMIFNTDIRKYEIESYMYTLIAILSDSWKGGHVKLISKYYEEHEKYNEDREINEVFLPVLIRDRSSMVEKCVSKILKYDQGINTKEYFANLFSDLIRLNDKSGLTTLTLCLYKSNEYFSLTLLALSIIERKNNTNIENSFPENCKDACPKKGNDLIDVNLHSNKKAAKLLGMINMVGFKKIATQLYKNLIEKLVLPKVQK